MQTSLLQGSLLAGPSRFGARIRSQAFNAHPRRLGARPVRLLRASAETSESPAADDESRRRHDSSKASGIGALGGNASGSSPLAAGLQLAGGGIITKIWGDRPPTDGPLNYAQMLEYLANKRVLRLMIYDEGKNAIVEVCVPGYEDEPYEKMEKQRFNVVLPGDYQEEVLRLAKLADRKAARPESGNVATRLYFVDPDAQFPQLIGQAASWLLPIVGASLFFKALDAFQTFTGKKKNLRKQMAEEFGRSRATRTIGFGKGNTGVLFDDVAGQDSAIAQLKELIAMMQGDAKFTIAGASLPKGILLEGPPGTGKTLLAKAVAGEAGVPFFSANGSEFVEMFVGVAASRVRDLFKRARQSPPAIIFIDEIDTLGRARTGSSDPGTREREQGLLQLLVEMDGFDTKTSNILVIGATNRKDVLDPALLRSGRLDRIIKIDKPDQTGRYDILKVHAKGKIVPRGADSVSEEFSEDALLRTTAMLTVGYSGADLANLLNEAGILAVRRNKPLVTMEEIETAMEKISIGLPRTPLPDSEYKSRLARIFAARAVVQTANADVAPDVLQVSVVPRGNAVGRVDSRPTERDPGEEIRLWPEAIRLVSLTLVGRAAEELYFGEEQASLLTARDVQEATRQAAQLVGQSGLYVRPVLGLEFNRMTFTEAELDRWPAVRERFDLAVRDVVDEAFRRARRMVRERAAAVDALAAELVEKNTVYGSRVRAIVREHPAAELPLEPLAVGPRDEFSVMPGACVFGRDGVGLVSFSRKAKDLWEAPQRFADPNPFPHSRISSDSGMGLLSFGFGGKRNVGQVGLIHFHGWRPARPLAKAAAAAAAAAAAQPQAAAAAGPPPEAAPPLVEAQPEAAAAAGTVAEAAPAAFGPRVGAVGVLTEDAGAGAGAGLSGQQRDAGTAGPTLREGGSGVLLYLGAGRVGRATFFRNSSSRAGGGAAAGSS